MSKNKGKPSGNEAEDKSAPGRKANYKRSGWPEDAPTQRVGNARRSNSSDEPEAPGESSGRNRKAGSPV
jgi:hypothetical protein